MNIFKLVASFMNKFMPRIKKADSKEILQRIQAAEQKFLRELKSIRADIKKLHENYDAALTKRRLLATKKLLNH